jgi:hypothetical protein
MHKPSIRIPGRALLGTAVLGLGMLLAATGCGSGGRSSLKGKVTMGGQPVTGGRLTFAPIGSGSGIPGEPASTEVQKDGTYDVGSKGAVPGKNRVAYEAPSAEWPPGVTPKPSVAPPASPFQGATVKTSEVEVKSGANTIDIELAPGKKQ